MVLRARCFYARLTYCRGRCTEGTILDRISKLSPSEFENLTFDCVKAVGLKNVVWRTPGADGGRDIEGTSFVRDISGQDVAQHWYVECKLYSSSLDWPTVWNKIAYADAQGADYLLVVTNNNPSPTCETKIAEWNSAKRRPIVRFWRGYDLPSLLNVHQRIAVMYGLTENSSVVQSSVLPLSLLISRTTQAAYAAVSFNSDPTGALEAASTLSELLSQRLDDLQRFGGYVTSNASEALLGFDWLEQSGSAVGWEIVGARAVTAFARHVTVASKATITIESGQAILTLQEAKMPLTGKGADDLDLVAGWGRLNVSYEDRSTQVTIGRGY